MDEESIKKKTWEMNEWEQILTKCDEKRKKLGNSWDEIKYLQNTKCLTGVFDREIRKCDLNDPVKKRF